jgi:hypothetical protein
MANPVYEEILETALQMAILDNGEYDVKGPEMVQWLTNMYMDRAKKQVLGENSA